MAITITAGQILKAADIGTGVEAEITMTSSDTLFVYERGLNVAVEEVVEPDWVHKLGAVRDSESFDLTYTGQVFRFTLTPNDSNADVRFKAWQA